MPSGEKIPVTERTLGPLPLDLMGMHELLGRTGVPRREGFRSMIEARAPELLGKPVPRRRAKRRSI